MDLKQELEAIILEIKEANNGILKAKCHGGRFQGAGKEPEP